MMGDVSFKILFMLAIAHYLTAYTLFSWANEDGLIRSHTHFFYYWVVTATTLGYGDTTPTTDAGKLIASLFMIPVSIALFGILLAKTGNSIATYFRKELTGMHSFESLKGHTLIVGYHPVRTGEMLNLLKGEVDNTSPVVLVSEQLAEHPFHDLKDVYFCRVESLKDNNSIRRMGVVGAAKFIVDGRDDNENYVLASHYAGLNPSSKVVTYIADTHSAERLQSQFSNVSVIIDNREELLVRGLMDSGSGTLVNRLLRVDTGPTFFMTPMSSIPAASTVGSVVTGLSSLGAIMVGYATDLQGNTLVLNPEHNAKLPAGPVYLHYIANARISPEQLTAKMAK